MLYQVNKVYRFSPDNGVTLKTAHPGETIDLDPEKQAGLITALIDNQTISPIPSPEVNP